MDGQGPGGPRLWRMGERLPSPGGQGASGWEFPGKTGSSGAGAAKEKAPNEPKRGLFRLSNPQASPWGPQVGVSGDQGSQEPGGGLECFVEGLGSGAGLELVDVAVEAGAAQGGEEGRRKSVSLEARGEVFAYQERTSLIPRIALCKAPRPDRRHERHRGRDSAHRIPDHQQR